MFGFGGNKNKRGDDDVEKPTQSRHEGPDTNANMDETLDQSSKNLVDSVALRKEFKELRERLEQDGLPDSINKNGAKTIALNKVKETLGGAKRTTYDRGAGGIAATVEHAGIVEHERACKYCGKPVATAASRKGGNHDICSKEYRQRDKNSLCVYCGKKYSKKHRACSKYENYGTYKPVIKDCEYCDSPVNPGLNMNRGKHDKCMDEWQRRYDNRLCLWCGEEILDPKAEDSDIRHRKCDAYEGYGAGDQLLKESAKGLKPRPPARSSTMPIKSPAEPAAGRTRPATVQAMPSTSRDSMSAGAEPRAGTRPILFDSVGGLEKEIQKIREAVELPLLRPDLFENAGVSAPKGVLLYGPSGTGKTLLATTIARQAGVNFTYVSAPSLLGKWLGDTEKWTRRIFKNAIENAPSIIFMDEIDSLGKDRSNIDRNYQADMTEQLLSSMDGLEHEQVVVIGATNRPDALDPAFRRPGRFDVEIEIGMPDERGRHDILKIHTAGMSLYRVNLKKMARLMHGFTGADIMAVAKEAGMSAIRRAIKNGPNAPPRKRKVRTTQADFDGAVKTIRPSILRDTERAVPDVRWDDIGGLDYVRDAIMEDVEWPRKHAGAYARMGIRTSRGILLHGPPGTGKTMIAKAVANGMDSNFITVGCPELISKYPGDTEKNIRNLFAKAGRARPCVIFLDEIDALLPERRCGIDNNRIVSQILVELDGVVKSDGVILMGATNMLDVIDKAALRPGRFDKIIEIKPPDMEGRRSILEVHIGKRPHGGMDLKRLASIAEGFTGADIAQAVNAASIMRLRRHIESKSKDMANLTLTHEAIEASILAARQEMNLPALNYVLGLNAEHARTLQGTDRARDADGK